MALKLLLAATALIVGGAIVSYVLVRRRHRDWRHFASRHALHFATTGTGPTVFGNVDGRHVVLRVRDKGSETNELGVAPIRIAVALDGVVPADLRVSESGPGVRAVWKIVDDKVVETGDGAFDGRFLVRARNPGDARAYLDADRRATLLDLAGANDSGLVGIENRALYVDARSIVSGEDSLDSTLDLLLQSGRRLDAVDTDALPARAASAS